MNLETSATGGNSKQAWPGPPENPAEAGQDQDRGAPPGAVPLISVIVPLYNVAPHAGRCIASLRAQILTDFEAIIVDDESTDDSLAVARAAARNDARFRFVTRANGGLSAARNSGLALARGAFVAFLDSDDAVTPGWLYRMHRALEDTGADWVASAIRFTYPDGGTTLHSAIHGAPVLPPAAEARPQRHDITDWCALIRHFPSAWNKLYRRSLIGDIRFDEGTYYEDHAFFWRLACRTDHLLHLPEPLYLHLRDRPGQITRDGGDRVFEQFAVLEVLQGILQAAPPGHRNGPEAFARIATRLIHERLAVLADRDRRARFIAQARDFMARHGLRWSAGWDATIPRGPELALVGQLAFSIVLPSDGDLAAVQASLEALEAQRLPDFDLLLVPTTPAAAEPLAPLLAGRPWARLLPCPDLSAAPDGPPDMPLAEAAVAAARNAGLAEATGLFTLFLDAGDRLLPWALADWLDCLLRHGPGSGGTAAPAEAAETAGWGADIGAARFRMGHATGPEHSGWHDRRGVADLWQGGALAPGLRPALQLHAHPSAKAFRTAFLHGARLRFQPGPLSSWLFLAEAMRVAGSAAMPGVPVVVIDESPACRRFWRAPVAPARLAQAVAEIGAALAAGPPDGPQTETPTETLPEGWQGRLYARAIWEKLHFADHGSPRAIEAFLAEARRIARDQGLTLQGAEADLWLGPEVRALLAPA